MLFLVAAGVGALVAHNVIMHNRINQLEQKVNQAPAAPAK